MSNKIISKKPWMLLSILASWLGLNSLWFNRYQDMMMNQDSILMQVSAVLIVGWILLSSFFACFHLMSFLFSLKERLFHKKLKAVDNPQSKIALLYLCKDDFKEKAVLSLLRQDTKKSQVFICDDSTLEEEKEKVDLFVKSHQARVQLIRRQRKEGFKAGNLNHALREIENDYPYFAVMDADEVAPSSFAREMMSLAEANPNLGFIQACHQQYGETSFAKSMGEGIDLHWKYYLPARNHYGFVYNYGHGVLFRTKAWKDVGGFPEIVSEDIAMATRLREKAWQGYYAKDIICQEEAAPTYAAMRKRNSKVNRGTLEFIFKYLPSFLKNKNVSWSEKLDLICSSSLLYLPIPFLFFVLLLHLVIPFMGSDNYSLAINGVAHEGGAYLKTGMGLLKPLWGWDTLAFTLFTIFSPLFYLLPNFLKSPLKITAYVFRSTSIHLSGIVHSFSQSFLWFGKGKTSFPVTGSRISSKSSYKFLSFEFVMASLLTALSIVTGSLCLLALGLSLLMVPLFMKRNLDSKLSRSLAILPLGLVILSFLFVPMTMVGATGVLFGVALAHH